MNIEYHKVGDYDFPNLSSKQTITSLSKYGSMRLQYLKQHCYGVYFKLQASGELYPYLEEIDKQANAMYDRLLVEYKQKRNITEALKESNQMLWVQEMNNIQSCIDEIIMKDVVYQ